MFDILLCLMFAGSPCSSSDDPKAQAPYQIVPAEPGSLLGLVPKEIQPPTEAPNAPLNVAGVVDPPLPPVVNKVGSPPAGGPQASPSSGSANVANIGVSVLSIVVFCLLSAGN